MKKKFFTLLSTGFIVMSLSACAGDNSTISMDEFEQIEIGMSYDEVVDIIGSEGELTSESDEVKIYSWEGKGSLGANALITFYDDEVYDKAQSGL